jgi:hypothetical protein
LVQARWPVTSGFSSPSLTFLFCSRRTKNILLNLPWCDGSRVKVTYLPEGRIREIKDKSDVKIQNVVWRDIIWRIPKEKYGELQVMRRVYLTHG